MYLDLCTLIYVPWFVYLGLFNLIFVFWFLYLGVRTLIYVPWFMYHDSCTMICIPWFMYHDFKPCSSGPTRRHSHPHPPSPPPTLTEREKFPNILHKYLINVNYLRELIKHDVIVYLKKSTYAVFIVFCVNSLIINHFKSILKQICQNVLHVYITNSPPGPVIFIREINLGSRHKTAPLCGWHFLWQSCLCCRFWTGF